MHVSWKKQAVVPPFITGTWRANTAARVVIRLIINDSNIMRYTIIIVLVTISVIEGLRMLDSSWVFKFRRLSLSIVLACSRNLNFFNFSFVGRVCRCSFYRACWELRLLFEKFCLSCDRFSFNHASFSEGSLVCFHHYCTIIFCELSRLFRPQISSLSHLSSSLVWWYGPCGSSFPKIILE